MARMMNKSDPAAAFANGLKTGSEIGKAIKGDYDAAMKKKTEEKPDMGKLAGAANVLPKDEDPDDYGMR